MRKLTSIGAVPEGDNPEAQILLYKMKGGQMAEVEQDVEQIEVEAAVEPVVEPVEPVVLAAEPADEIAKRIADAETEIAKARDERDAALQSLADEVAKRRHADFTAKAATLEPLLGPAEETAGPLDVLEAAAPEAFADLEKRLGLALERVQLTRELGTAGDEGADPIRKRDAWVRKYTLDHPEITEIQARALFWKSNTDALEAQRKDQQ